jgi:hypothetical protein
VPAPARLLHRAMHGPVARMKKIDEKEFVRCNFVRQIESGKSLLYSKTYELPLPRSHSAPIWGVTSWDVACALGSSS